MPADAATIAKFNSAIARETEDKRLDADVVGPGVATLLADPSKGRYWVAESGGQIVGQLMVTYEWSDWRNGVFWWVQSVYVRADHRRQGIYRRLYQHVKQLAASHDVCGFRLYVERDNAVAQQTYAAMGMHETVYKMFEEPK